MKEVVKEVKDELAKVETNIGGQVEELRTDSIVSFRVVRQLIESIDA